MTVSEMSDVAGPNPIETPAVEAATHILAVIAHFDELPSDALNPTVRHLRTLRPIIESAARGSGAEQSSSAGAAEVEALAVSLTSKLTRPLWLPSRSDIASVRNALLRIAAGLISENMVPDGHSETSRRVMDGAAGELENQDPAALAQRKATALQGVGAT